MATAPENPNPAATGLRMRTAILVVLLMAVLPALVLQTAIYYYWFRSAYRHEVQADTELSRLLAATLASYVRGVGEHEATLVTAFTEKGLAPPEEMEPILQASAAQYPALNAFLFINPEGRVVVSSDRRLVGMEVADRDYFRQACQTDGTVLSDLLEGRVDPRPIFLIARRVWARGRLLGVLSASVNPDRLGDAALKVSRSGIADISFFDRRGQLVYRDPSPPLTWRDRRAAESDDLLKQALAGREAVGSYRFPGESGDRLGARVPVGNLGWVAGAGEPVRDVIAGPLKSLLLAAGINAAVVAMSLAGAWFVSRTISRGVYSLRARALAIGKGREGPAARPGPIAEIRDLAASLEEMAVLRREGEKALRAREEEFRAFFETAAVGAVQIDLDGRYVRANDRYCQIVGYSRRELTGRSPLELVHPEDREEDQLKIAQFLRGELPIYDVEKRFIRKDGRVVWVHVTAAIVHSPEGKPLRTAAVVEDITEWKRAETVLLESEAKYRSLVEESLVGVYLIQDGLFVYVNPQLAAIFGYGREEIQGVKSVGDLVAPEDRPAVLEKIRQRVEGEVLSVHYTFRGLRKDGRGIDVEVIGSYTVYGGRSAVIGTLLDITQKKRATEELEKLAGELARSNRDLEQFAAVASHDLQEPLRTIQGHLGIVERRLKDKLDHGARVSMDFVLDGAARMEAMISDLLAYSRVGRGAADLAATDMEAVLVDVQGGLRASIESAGAVVTHQPLPKIKAHPSLMAQLLQNLIANAIKYRSKEKKPEIEVGARREESGWTFWVRDNGIGIRREDAERIFLIFQRLHTRQEYPGTGIGLAICKKIVERQGGRIWVESTPGEGATFFFTVPDRD